MRSPCRRGGISPRRGRRRTLVDGRQPTRVTIESLRAFGIEAFERAGLGREGAVTIVEVQLESNLRGQATHHMGDVPGYARRLAAGQLNRQPNFRWEREGGVSALLNADNAPGQWAATVA